MIEGDLIILSTKHKKDLSIIIVNYIILCIAIVILMFSYNFTEKNTVPRYSKDISDEWHDHDGDKVDLDKFEIKNNKKNYSVTYTIPKGNKKNQMIAFLASNCYVDTYVNGKLIEKDIKNNNVVFGASPGRRWHMISIPQESKKQDIALNVEVVYRDSYGRIDDVYIGMSSGVVKQILQDRLAGALISFLLVIVGILMCSLFIFVKYSNKFKKIKDLGWSNKTIIYLGFLTICMGIYSSMETYFWQFMIGKSQIFQIASYIALFFIGILVGLIGREILTDNKKILANSIYWLSIIFFILATILNFTGILEYHYVMRYIYLYGALLSIIVFLEGYTYIKEQKSISSSLLFGVCLFSVTFACDCIRYISEGANDVCAYTRIGFLVLVICIFINSVGSVIKMMQKGLYADLYEQMANMDPLTNLYNRNALLLDETRLNELIRNDSLVGVVMFDVNELKYVNDTFGHEQGDILIKAAAELINSTFGKGGKCYRVGGDEFISVLVHEDIKKVYDDKLSQFISQVEEYNKAESHQHKVKIAYGFYYSNKEEFDEIWKKADTLMYEKKKQMKN